MSSFVTRYLVGSGTAGSLGTFSRILVDDLVLISVSVPRPAIKEGKDVERKRE